jgi:prepilin-type N-terminal cleavage/methylation domain-containing protein
MPYLLPLTYSGSKAFTLSELLISLAILGLIATFTVPKVIANIDVTLNKNILKKQVSIMQEIMYTAAQKGFLVANQSPTYSISTITLSMNCSEMSAIRSNGTPVNIGNAAVNRTTCVLHDGSTIKVFRDSNYEFTLDANGDKSPNTIGVDQLKLYFQTTGCHDCKGPHSNIPLRFYTSQGWSDTNGTANDNYYRYIFSR